ncbi:helix-turn-helix transcriptional regulator [Streptomyces sp. NRRL F-2664]|uniref:helix-turn-helix transcriptional regulator n=1 Tax=Streptomyces sp. NRRL F-2664 TaxID=1463842 RepID=UPI00131B3EF8|nr:helix-turn-helix transcriptional regulator [Streptomyces sp. NRRL F-2664]
MTRTRFATRDHEEARAFLDRAYGTSLRARGELAGQLLSHERMSAGALTWEELVVPGELSYTCDPLERIVFSMPRRGRLDLEIAGQDNRVGRGDVIVNTPGASFRGASSALTTQAITLDPRIITQVALVPADAPREKVTFTGTGPVNPTEARRWLQTSAYVRSVLSGPAAPTPLVSAELSRLVAATALAVFPHSRGPAPRPADRGDATSDTLRRAIEFIEDNAHRDISLADIASSIPCTPRAVQYAFARHADTTPLAHLRRVRLARAHADLQAADPRTQSVTAIAAKWGFAHPGRFAGLHRQAYGVGPSAVLHDPPPS